MRTLGRVLITALPPVLMAGLLTLTPSPADALKTDGKKIALLVGVNVYDNRKLDDLKYAERDVIDLAGVLTDAGFTVRLLLGSKSGKDEATRANVAAAFDQLLQGVGKKDTLLLGFSGHGAQLFVKEKNADGKEVEREAPYFVPKDGVPSDASTLTALNDILRTLDERGGGANLMLVDACRNLVDPNKGTRGGVDGSRVENLGEGTAVFFSCSNRQRSRETDQAGGGHGVFFHFVLQGLRGADGARDDRGQVTWQSLVPYVKRRVKEDAPGWFPGLDKEELQRPHDIANLTDDPVLTAALRGARPSPLDCTGEKGVSAADVRKSQEAWAKYLGRQVEEEDEIAPGVKMKFVLVPPGRFLMGSPEGEKQREKDETLHEVVLTHPFYMGVYDVTQGQYEAATGKTPSDFKGADLPVEQVSWEEADAFANKLTDRAKEGLVYRLPTESEWEYSCRGGRPSSMPFGIGDGTSLSSREANFDGDYPYGGAEKGPTVNKTTAVGTYKVNALGMYDMQGNVYQWCADWYGAYPAGKATDPSGPPSGSYRVLRGGGWGNDGGGDTCRAANRYWGTSGGRIGDRGFRLARVTSGLDK
jgi:formylglycine-generating enzyme required for sulfatase activity